MTEQEAFKILNPKTTLKALAEIEYFNGFNGLKEVDRAMSEAVQLALKVLQKQIPQKVEKTTLHFDGEFYKCPICENLLNEEQIYCDECGQHLLWQSQMNRSDENGKISRIEDND